MAQMAIRLNWTWIGAVLANNDYGQKAIQVHVFLLCCKLLNKSLCPSYIIKDNIVVAYTSIFQVFQEEIKGKRVCLEFIETVHRETIVSDARRVALTIQSSTATVILIFCWYTDVQKIFVELAKRNVSKIY